MHLIVTACCVCNESEPILTLTPLITRTARTARRAVLGENETTETPELPTFVRVRCGGKCIHISTYDETEELRSGLAVHGGFTVVVYSYAVLHCSQHLAAL